MFFFAVVTTYVTNVWNVPMAEPRAARWAGGFVRGICYTWC